MSQARTIPEPTGNPAALERAVDDLAATEAALERAAADIATSLAEGVGRAIEALRQRDGHARQVLDAAHSRYQGTRTALRDFAVELRTFHASVHRAGDADEHAQRARHLAALRVDEARRELRRSAMNPDDAATVDYWTEQLQSAVYARDNADGEAAAAWSDYQHALEALDDAAHTAMARIEASFEGTNDGWADKVGAFIDGVGDLLASFGEWVEGFFNDVFHLIVDAIALFLLGVLIVVVIVAVVAAIVVAMALAQVVMGLACVALAAIVAEAVILLNVLVRALVAAEVLGVEGLARIRFVVAALEFACPPLAWLIHARIENELSKPPLAVTELDRSGLSPDQRSALDRIDGDHPHSAADILAWGGYVDTIGGTDQAVIDIAQVKDEAGRVSWIVTLPSTKDWVLGGDEGAPNDLDADLLLMLFPELRSHYETAVLDAMAQAGIGADEPVVLAGWSLGGILAASLVESGAGDYEYAGVICAGSPIDHMAIPCTVPVLQVKHTLDPVHRLDMVDSVADTGNHISVWDGLRSGGKSTEIQTGNVVGHHNGDYVETLRNHLEDNRAHGGPDLSADFAVVMPYDDPSTPQRVTVDHVQYACAE